MKKPLALLAAIILITIIFGTIGLSVQQSLRIGANSPQIQLAEDAANALNTGTIPTDITTGKVKINSSLATFIIIYDKAGKVVSGNGYLNDNVPTVPIGMLTNSKDDSYSSVTWQPQSGVRIAAVTVSANNYYVLSGKSLTEVEKLESRTTLYSVMGWICSVAIMLGVYSFSNLLGKSKKKFFRK
jgi:hypothetical protein